MEGYGLLPTGLLESRTGHAENKGRETQHVDQGVTYTLHGRVVRMGLARANSSMSNSKSMQSFEIRSRWVTGTPQSMVPEVVTDPQLSIATAEDHKISAACEPSGTAHPRP